MNQAALLDTLFSIASTIVLPGWLLLIFFPRWKWTQRYAALLIPLLLGPVYVWLLVTTWGGEGGFGSLAEVAALFRNPAALLGGWIHYLVFDLFLGAWETRDAAANRIAHLAIIPCLLLTFLLGPSGLLLYLLIRLVWRKNPDLAGHPA
jgi:hypothetical protein